MTLRAWIRRVYAAWMRAWAHDGLRGSVGLFLNGIALLALSLVVWRLTGSWIGWFVLFVPGSIYIAWGWKKIVLDE